MTKPKDNKIYIFMTFFLITPLLSMIGNLLEIKNYAIWYIPNLIMFIIGTRTILMNTKQIKKYKLLTIFALTAIISCLLAENKYEAFFGGDYRLQGLVTYIGFLGFFYIGKKMISEEKNKKIIKIFLISACITSIISLLRIDITYKLQDIPKDIPYYFYQGPFSHFNHFGYYLLIANTCAVMTFLYTKNALNKIIYFIVNIILLYTLVINDTFGVYIAYLIILIAVVIYQIIKQQKIKEIIIITLSFIMISLFTYRTDFNIHIVERNFKELFHDTKEIANTNAVEDLYEVGTTRGKLWIYATKFILKKPLIGYGFENGKYQYHKEGITESVPHNLILEMSLNSGIIGMITYLSLIGIIIIKKLKKLKIIKYMQLMSLFVVIGYLLSSMFGNQTFYVSPYFYMFLGILAQSEVKNEI